MNAKLLTMERAMSISIRSEPSNDLVFATTHVLFDAQQTHAQSCNLKAGQKRHDADAQPKYARYPLTAVVSQISPWSFGGAAEVTAFGREGYLGLRTSLVCGMSLNRDLVQFGDTA